MQVAMLLSTSQQEILNLENTDMVLKILSEAEMMIVIVVSN